MDEEDRRLYGNVVNVIVAMTSAANKLTVAVDELTSAVTTLCNAVTHLERPKDEHEPTQ